MAEGGHGAAGFTSKASTELLLALSKKIPTEWYRLGIHLGFDFEAVDGIQSNEHFQSPQDKALEMLKLWVKHNGDNATVQVLAGALGKAKRQDLVHWLQTQAAALPDSKQAREHETRTRKKRKHGESEWLFEQSGHKAAATPEETHWHSPPKKAKAKSPKLKELRNLAREVLEFWFDLGLELEVPEEREDNKAWQTEYDKANKMLETWRDMGSSSTYKELGDALRCCEKGTLAEKYCSVDG